MPVVDGIADSVDSLMDGLNLQFEGIQQIGQQDSSKVGSLIIEQDFCIIPSVLWVFQIRFLEIRISLPIEDCMELVHHLGVVLGIRYV